MFESWRQSSPPPEIPLQGFCCCSCRGRVEDEPLDGLKDRVVGANKLEHVQSDVGELVIGEGRHGEVGGRRKPTSFSASVTARTIKRVLRSS